MCARPGRPDVAGEWGRKRGIRTARTASTDRSPDDIRERNTVTELAVPLLLGTRGSFAVIR